MWSRLQQLNKAYWYVLYVLCGLIILAVVLNIPVNQHNTLTQGIDRYEDHRPLFGTHTQSQDVLISRGLQGVGAILVNLTHTEDPTDILVTVSNPKDGTTLRQATISGHSLVDDAFTTVTFSEPLHLTNQIVRITLAAPQATSKTALGVRFNPDDVYAYSTRLEDNEAKPGDLSLTLVEKVPVWQYIQTSITQNPDRTWTIMAALGISLLVSFLALFLTPLAATGSRNWWPTIIVIIIAILSLSWRFTVIPQYKGVSGGDPYNYLFITQKIAHWQNPLENTKRLPGFPLLLLPAYLTSLDDQDWMRGISSISAVLIICVLPLLARSITLPWSVQLLSIILLAVTKDFWLTSLRPEPYTFYTLLVILALWLLYNLKKWPHQLALGLVLGYAAMTRQEGFVLAVVIGFCTLWFWRILWWRGYLTIFLPALLLVTPFFIHNAIAYGNPFFTSYFDGDRLQIVDSWASFVDNLGASWGVLGSWWWPHWDQLSRVSFTQPLFITVFLATLGWTILKQFQHLTTTKTFYLLTALIGLLLTISSSYIAVTQKATMLEVLLATTAGLLVGSVLSFLIATRWRGVPIMLVVISQGLIAVWFHPFAKHFQQILPLLCLMVATALAWPVSKATLWPPRLREQLASIIWYIGLLTPLAISTLWLWQAWLPELDRENEHTALDSVVYRAIQDTQHYPGPYGVDQAYLPARLYFDGIGQYFTGDEKHTVVDEENWLKQFNIHTLVVTNNNPAFKTLPDGWQQVAHHKSAGQDEMIYESWVYTLP